MRPLMPTVINKEESKMAYCAICGNDHSPDYHCSGLVDEKLRGMGIESGHKMPRKEFRKLEKRANKYMLKLLLILTAIFILVITAGILISR